MRIDKKKYPIIQQVQKGKLEWLQRPSELSSFAPYLHIARSIVARNPRVDYLCRSTLGDIFSPDAAFVGKELYDTQGILLYKSASVLYRVNVKEEIAELDFFVYCEDTLITYGKGEIRGEEIELIYSVSLLQNRYGVEPIMDDLCFMYQYLAFKKHVEVQEKVISTKKSRTCKTLQGEVKTDFKYPINVIDASYYTSYVKGEKFPVKGHPRKCKSGKVTQVRPHEKGYSRPAKKLSIAA